MCGHTGLSGNTPYPYICVINVNDQGYNIQFVEKGIENIHKYINVPIIASVHAIKYVGKSGIIPNDWPKQFICMSNLDMCWDKILEINKDIQTKTTHESRLRYASKYMFVFFCFYLSFSVFFCFKLKFRIKKISIC